MVQQSLVDEGLYEKEAASMVKTWQQSWFTENGTRVLYMVPGPTTDELLPLYVTPRPQEMLRVLVGRMEIMSPEDEQRMIQAVAASSKARAEHDAKPVANGQPQALRDSDLGARLWQNGGTSVGTREQDQQGSGRARRSRDADRPVSKIVAELSELGFAQRFLDAFRGLVAQRQF